MSKRGVRRDTVSNTKGVVIFDMSLSSLGTINVQYQCIQLLIGDLLDSKSHQGGLRTR